MCGFVYTIGAFFLFLLILGITNLAFTAFFFFLASAAPIFNVANPISSISIFFILFGGFVITKEQTPDYLIWIYRMNPIAWCVYALSVNQDSDSAFDKCVYGDVNFCENFNQTVGRSARSRFRRSKSVCGMESSSWRPHTSSSCSSRTLR
ncbi:hypothetical protein V7S43_013853 [Phytophthora oleae]|uniref:ABC-2 type transporter transmembrane domain-containing protein n=1 Tax=Phytophthora oleae TaxID=2107226 RepID=A0ABD3F4P9_9STRA